MVRLSQLKELLLEIKPLTHVILDTILLVLKLFTVRMMDHILMELLNVNVSKPVRFTTLLKLFLSVVDCGAPDPADPNGSMQFTTTTFQSKVVYSCNAGYTLDGQSMSVCQASGEWSSEAPTCERRFSAQYCSKLA